MDDQHTETSPQAPSSDRRPSRRQALSLAAGVGAFSALGGLPAFAASKPVVRQTLSPLLSAESTTVFWYQSPASDTNMIEQGLPVGNGRLGALTGNDPAREVLLVTEARLRGVGGRSTTVAYGGKTQKVSLKPGASVSLRDLV